MYNALYIPYENFFHLDRPFVDMPSKYGDQKTERILTLRALDFTKQAIAEKLDISRHTVRNHLQKVREEVKNEMSIDEIVKVEYKPDDGSTDNLFWTSDRERHSPEIENSRATTTLKINSPETTDLGDFDEFTE